MAYQVKLTHRAERDLDLLYDSIGAEHLEAALKWYRGLKRAILSLEHSPLRCPLIPEDKKLATWDTIAVGMQERVIEQIPGASDLMAWFGSWPSFHDAEVLSIHLNRSGESRVAIRTWHRTNEIDHRGNFIATKHVLVTFVLDGIQTIQLNDFNHQNVVSGLSLEKTAAGYRLTLDPCFGAEGMLEAQHIRIIMQPSATA